MKRDPEVIIEELKQTQEDITTKEEETYQLKHKEIKLKIELAEATHHIPTN